MSNFDKLSVADEGFRSETPSVRSFVEDDTASAISDLTIDSGTEGRHSKIARDPKKAIEQVLVTKPEHIDSKCGSSGTKVQLKANMFQIEEFTDFEFNQYRVDFVPDLDMENIRKAFIGKNISPFGGK